MELEPIGIVAAFLGLVCLPLGLHATAALFVGTTLLGAAAALNLGAASIQPSHFFLCFVVLLAATRPQIVATGLAALRPPQPGFWFLALLVYGAVTGFLMPRLLAGATQIIPLGASEYADTGSTVPLGPVSSNITQVVYLTGDLVCFAVFVAIASTRDGMKVMVNAVLALAIANVVFAALDVATYSTGTQAVLDPIRNARYTLHHEEEVAGMKRIVGSFTEASSFAGTTLGIFGFVATLWLCGYRPLLTGLVAAVSLALVVLSTSSTGVAGIGPVLALLYVTALMRSGLDPSRRFSAATVLLAPLLAALVMIGIVLNEQVWTTLYAYVDSLILSKSTSASGVERSSWNTFGMQNFFDSYGIGIGLGTNRTSSFPIALLSNVGVPGTVFYLLFLWGTVARRIPADTSIEAVGRLAARNSCLAFLVGSVISGPVIDQGLLFYALAALLAASPATGTARAPLQARRAFA